MSSRPAEVEFSCHALERYQERGFPAADLETATDHLIALCANASINASPPPWLIDPHQNSARAYLCIGDIVFPMKQDLERENGYVALTCITRGVRKRRSRKPRREQHPNNSRTTT